MPSTKEQELAKARNRSATIQWIVISGIAFLAILAVFVYGIGGSSGIGGN